MKRVPTIVKQLLQKARDSAMLAVEYYNKPAVSFKSEGYITMMIIAWNSLFHAYFLKNKIKPFYRKKSAEGKRPRYEYVFETLPDGKKIKEKRWWELSECVKQYFQGDNSSPVRKNLEFFIPLRNMIVHRHIPELDDSIFGECQALLINFDNFIKQHFGEKYAIKQFLSFSLQLAKTPKNFIGASKEELRKKKVEEIIQYIKTFRSSLTTEQFESPEYSFKAILIQVRNHQSRDALPLKFIHEKDLTDEQREKLKDIGVVLIKEKHIQMDKIPENFTLSYGELKSRIKENIPHIKNPQFEKYKKYLRIRYKDKLAYERIHNPRSKKSQSTWYYDPKIIDEFKKLCPSITSQNKTIVKRIEHLVDLFLSLTQSENYLENPQKQARVKEYERQIDQLVYKLYDLTDEEIKIVEEEIR